MAQELTFNKSVAIIGAGPAGCICAKFLIDSGIIPTIFDKGKYLGVLTISSSFAHAACASPLPASA